MSFWKCACTWYGNAPSSLHCPQTAVQIKFISSSFVIIVWAYSKKENIMTRLKIAFMDWCGIYMKFLLLDTKYPKPRTLWNVILMLIIWKEEGPAFVLIFHFWFHIPFVQVPMPTLMSCQNLYLLSDFGKCDVLGEACQQLSPNSRSQKTQIISRVSLKMSPTHWLIWIDLNNYKRLEKIKQIYREAKIYLENKVHRYLFQ